VICINSHPLVLSFDFVIISLSSGSSRFSRFSSLALTRSPQSEIAGACSLVTPKN
jgi:hypothetical protein